MISQDARTVGAASDLLIANLGTVVHGICSVTMWYKERQVSRYIELGDIKRTNHPFQASFCIRCRRSKIYCLTTITETSVSRNDFLHCRYVTQCNAFSEQSCTRLQCPQTRIFVSKEM